MNLDKECEAWPIREQLILAQAVYRFGWNNWYALCNNLY
jgi:hypothetical protein